MIEDARPGNAPDNTPHNAPEEASTNTPDTGLPVEEAKDRVKGATLAVFRHYAGAPRSSPAPEKGPEGRYTFDCPGCGSARGLKVVLFEDGRPAGYGRGGCSSSSCPVPKNGDALEFVRALLSRGKTSVPTFGDVLAAALHAARGPIGLNGNSGGHEDAPAVPDEPSGPFVSGSLALPPDPLQTESVEPTEDSLEESSADSSAVLFELPPDPSDGAASPAVRAARGGASRADSGARSGRGGGRPSQQEQPTLLPEADEAKVDLDARAAVYEELLRLCPPDERLVEDLKALGVSEVLARRESFGAFYPARASEVLASLQLSLGATALIAAPGFDAPAGRSRGPVRFELEGSNDDALYALVPYRDARARVVALEAISLSGTRGFGGNRLLGCPPDGRDPHLGGAHHVWFPGEPHRIQAVTDDLLEGLRAASAGVRCAATRGPQSFDAGAGNDSLPGLRDVTFGGARILYAPSPSARAREAAPRAARAIVSHRGGVALVLKHSFEEKSGLGSYLLANPLGERTRAFALLCSETNAALLPAEEVARLPAVDPTQAAPRMPATGPEPDVSAFEAEARKALEAPPRSKGPLTSEILAGVAAAALVIVGAWAPIIALSGPARGLLGAAASALTASSGGADASLPLGEPLQWLPWIAARVLGSWAEPVAAALAALADGASLTMVLLGAAVLVAVTAGLTVTGFRQRHRRKRIKMMAGRLKQW